VSQNDNCHCAGTTKDAEKSHGKERLRKKPLSHPWNADIEGVDVTCWGRLFHL